LKTKFKPTSDPSDLYACKTLKEIGIEMGISKTTVGILLKSAMDKIRSNPEAIKIFQQYITGKESND
jgi:DNA-directed RNA polymerase sigma subunit (sigma70/sigma32)